MILVAAGAGLVALLFLGLLARCVARKRARAADHEDADFVPSAKAGSSSALELAVGGDVDTTV
jgi:hypothetical protein